jgi:hypothetical protein
MGTIEQCQEEYEQEAEKEKAERSQVERGVIKRVICDHAREDCDGCQHSEPHKRIIEGIGGDATCEKVKKCGCHEIKVKCIQVL